MNDVCLIGYSDIGELFSVPVKKQPSATVSRSISPLYTLCQPDNSVCNPQQSPSIMEQANTTIAQVSMLSSIHHGEKKHHY